MDFVTHLAIGAMAPLVFRRAPRMAPLALFGFIAGILPDIDLLTGSSFPAIFSIHQGITHSLLFLVVCAFLLALLFKLFLSKLRLKKQTVQVMDGLARITRLDDWNLFQMFLAALLGLGLHIYLTCMSGFSAPIFWPFSPYLFSAPALFAVDPLLTMPILIIFFYCLRHFKSRNKRAQQIKWARYALAWAFLYPLLCLGIQEGLSRKYNRDYTEVGTSVEKITLSPVLFSPFYWKAVAENGEEYRMIWIAAYKFLKRPYFDPPAYPKADPALLRKLEKEAPIFAEYKDFARLPSFEKHVVQGFTEYVFQDLRYVYALPNFIQSRLDESGEGLFRLSVRLGKDGRIHAWRYQDCFRGSQDPWEEIPFGMDWR